MKRLAGFCVSIPFSIALACGDTDEGGNAGSGASGDAGASGGALALAGEATGASASLAGGGPMADAGGGPTGEGGAPEGQGAGQSGAGGEGGGETSTEPRSVLEAGPGDLVISEIMNDPSVVDDVLGEWFEIYNRTARPFELAGLELADGSGSVIVTGSGMIEAHGYAVFARNGSAGNGGVQADFVYGDVLQLSNGSDRLTIAAGAQLVDQVSYGEAAEFPSTAGASMSLKVAALDGVSNDSGQNWCAAGTSFGSGDLGSPGSANGACLKTSAELAAAELVITEIMGNPAAVSDALGEWFEIYNPTDVAVDLAGLKVHDQALNSFVIDATLLVAPGKHVVLGSNATTATNGGVPIDYAYSYADFVFANTSDEVVLSTSFVIDSVAYTTGSVHTGTSMSLSPAKSNALDNDALGNWCDASTSRTSGDRATPGAANDACSL